MHRRVSATIGLCLLISGEWAPLADAQSVTIRADALFYGDNTEFRNPFREGETIFGAAIGLAADLELSHRALLSLGAFGNQRFGGDDAFELVRPIVTLP